MPKLSKRLLKELSDAKAAAEARLGGKGGGGAAGKGKPEESIALMVRLDHASALHHCTASVEAHETT